MPSSPPSQRRGFLRLASAAAAGAASLLVAAPWLGFLFGKRQRKVVWVDLGPIDSFTTGETRLVSFDNPLAQPWDGITGETGVFVRRVPNGDDGREQFLVFAVNCAHLGCPVSWFPQSELFLCPCHGGVYYATGERASGPPPRGLFHCVWRVTGGKLEIQAPHYPTLHDTLREHA